MLVCTECIVHQHLDCPGVVSAEEYASEERQTVKMCRVKYAQVCGESECVFVCVHEHYFCLGLLPVLCVCVCVCVCVCDLSFRDCF